MRKTLNARTASFAVAAAAVVGLMAWGVVGASASVSAEEEFDINKVFWCDAGKKTFDQTEAECTASREAILGNCTACHAITPIVKAQKTKQGWTAFLADPSLARARYRR